MKVEPRQLPGHGVRLEPLVVDHHADLLAAASDGRLWDLWYTSVPEPDGVAGYIAEALAIEALGARKDGVIRHQQRRRDGTVRDTVMYSVLANEWPDIRRHLRFRLQRHGESADRPPTA